MGLLEKLSQYGLSDITNWLEYDFKIKSKEYTTEKNVEKILCEELLTKIKKREHIHSQYNIGGFLPLKIDVDLYDGGIGIELKLAKNLDKSIDIERLLGQIIYYSKRKYDWKLIVLVVGKKEEYTGKIKELKKIIEEMDFPFVYKSVS